VVSGRGDLNADGVVDILDLVLGIDLVLGRIDSTQVDIVAADLFPFPAGDGVSDVRDLTVLSQAIGRDQWPDGVPLDATTPAAKTQSNLFADATVVLERGPSALSVRLESAEPFRALHVVLDLPEAMRSKTVALETGTVEGATLAATPRWDDGSLSLMLYRMDGRALGAGEFDLVRIPVGTGDLDTTVRRALVVNARLERAVARTAVRLSDDTPSVPEHRTGIDAPFPVPLVPGTGLVHLPVRLDDDENGRLEIYDVRGALIRLLYEGEMAGGSTTWMWDGTDRNDRPVAPGVYFVRLQTISQIDHRAVVVTR
jgi:hypothetical protein